MPTRRLIPSKLPQNWPSNVPYLTSSLYSPTLLPTHHAALQTRPTDTDIPILDINTVQSPSPNVKIVPITTESHPACGQAGLFAARDLKPGEFVLLYLGVVHASSSSSHGQRRDDGAADATPNKSCDGSAVIASTGGIASMKGDGTDNGEGGSRKSDAHGDSDYDLSLDRELGLGIDAATRGNEARFINDYRGVRERPNAEFRECWVEDGARTGTGERRMGVWILPVGRKGKGKGKGVVRKGEEILVSYGRGFWVARREVEAEWEAGNCHPDEDGYG